VSAQREAALDGAWPRVGRGCAAAKPGSLSAPGGAAHAEDASSSGTGTALLDLVVNLACEEKGQAVKRFFSPGIIAFFHQRLAAL
jgi:hypothetical protein